ncbi:MAG: hypothetical protein EXS31_00575 [Pedosphaera sp.]|nr:hypothetical protein [Pedosphaera sp.]
MKGALEKVGGWLGRTRDAAGSMLVERAAQKLINNYGRMLNLRIDSKNNSIHCEILLKGEATPIQISINKYELTTDDSGTCLVIRDASASREWMTTVLSQFALGRKIRVPDEYAPFVRLLA